MERRFTLQDLTENFVRRSHLPQKEAEDFAHLFFAQIEDGLLRENMVKVKGFGVFKLVDVESRESIDVNTGMRIEIAGHTKVSFTPDPVLRDAVNKPFSDFETVLLHESTSLEEMEAQTQPEQLVEETPHEENPLADEPMAGELQPIAVEEEMPQPVAVEEDTPHPVAVEEETPQSVAVEEDPLHPVAVEKEPSQPVEEEEKPQPAVVEETPLVQKAAVVEEAEVVQHAHQVAHSSGHRWGHILFSMLAAMVFFAIGYAIGFYWRPINLPGGISAEEVRWLLDRRAANEQMASAPAAPAKPVAPAPVKSEVDSAQKDTTQAVASAAPVRPQQKQPSEVLAYPQLEEGEYHIVGVKATEVMTPGKTLLNISLKYYKSKDFVPYICVMNGIKNPDVVPLNKELRIPELKHK